MSSNIDNNTLIFHKLHGIPTAIEQPHMNRLIRFHRRDARGFSLPELLVVIAIMGLIVMVSVPNFIAYFQSNKVKTSLRVFNTDVRAARQRAVTRNSFTRVTFRTGVGANQYRVFESLDRGATWAVAPYISRELEEPVYFESTGFGDTAPATPDTAPDIVFRNDGAVQDHPGGTDDYVVIRTTHTIPRNEFTIRISAAGAVRTD